MTIKIAFYCSRQFLISVDIRGACCVSSSVNSQ